MLVLLGLGLILQFWNLSLILRTDVNASKRCKREKNISIRQNTMERDFVNSYLKEVNAHGSRLTGVASPISWSAGGLISELPEIQHLKSVKDCKKTSQPSGNSWLIHRICAM